MTRAYVRVLCSHVLVLPLIAVVLLACNGDEPAGRDSAPAPDAAFVRFENSNNDSGFVGQYDASIAFDSAGIGQPNPDAGAGSDGPASLGVVDSGVVDASSPPPDPLVVDFIAEAPNARWHNNDGNVAWPMARGDESGSCTFLDAKLEDGSQRQVLFTHPKWVDGGFMHGAYFVTVPPASEQPKLDVTFGFLDGADRCGTTGMRFAVAVKVNNEWQYLINVIKDEPNGVLNFASADLSADWLAGQTLEFALAADAVADAGCDWGAWTEARITRSSP